MTLVQNIRVRNEILAMLVRMYEAAAVPDYMAICQILVHLEDHVRCANILLKLIKSGDDVSVAAIIH